MTGAETLQSKAGVRGDPEFVNVIPPGEYLSSYVFFTDPTYPETNLVITRVATAGGTFDDVTIDCGTGGGASPAGCRWGAAASTQYARFDLSTGDFAGVNGCNNGRHEIKSNTPFGLTVWGWGSEATGAILLGVRELRVPGGRQRAADQHRRRPADGPVIQAFFSSSSSQRATSLAASAFAWFSSCCRPATSEPRVA